MKKAEEALKELESSIEKSLRLYQQKLCACQLDDGSIWPDESCGVIYSRDTTPVNDWLRTVAVDKRTCAINLWQQYQLPEPPKTEAEPLVELQNIRQWCIKVDPSVEVEKPEQNIPLRYIRAYEAYERALQHANDHSVLFTGDLREIYNYCRNNFNFDDYVFPHDFETWNRYYREYVRLAHEKRNQ